MYSRERQSWTNQLNISVSVNGSPFAWRLLIWKLKSPTTWSPSEKSYPRNTPWLWRASLGWCSWSYRPRYSDDSSFSRDWPPWARSPTLSVQGPPRESSLLCTLCPLQACSLLGMQLLKRNLVSIDYLNNSGVTYQNCLFRCTAPPDIPPHIDRIPRWSRWNVPYFI